ncbi:MAG: hypothetical protein HY536_00780, partial [Candidatus Colwellbacteria bacterium]|nr:hypothetical protein [Candidatus Colwellbacteria bacterium]
ERIGAPFYVWDFEEEYKERVVGYMIREYQAGRTPNPDVMCNREIKFGLFLKKALAMGADYVATGHYVRIRTLNIRRRMSGARRRISEVESRKSKVRYSKSEIRNPAYSLFRARDGEKDQSYFLWTLTQDELKYCLFPIGAYEKSAVRAIARKAGLHTAGKKDSQGICFLGKVSLKKFLAERIPVERGPVYAASGAKVGEHDGAALYTIGERHGLRLGARERLGGAREPEPLYVAEKDMGRNALVVVEGGDHPSLRRKSLELEDVNWLLPMPPRDGQVVCARVRYRQPLAQAEFSMRGGSALLEFRVPQRFVAPGQSAVFYSSRGELLGGGVIARAT